MHLGELLRMDYDSGLNVKHIAMLLKHCADNFAFIDSVTIDIVVQLFINNDKLLFQLLRAKKQMAAALN